MRNYDNEIDQALEGVYDTLKVLDEEIDKEIEQLQKTTPAELERIEELESTQERIQVLLDT